MQNIRLDADSARYFSHKEYHHDHLAHSKRTWLVGNPSRGPLPMSQGPYNIQPNQYPWYSFSTVSESIKRLLRRRPFTSETHSLPPSFVRRSRGPLTSGGSPSISSTFRFLMLCILWYTTSALSSNTGKVILEQFRYPVTLTIIQFAFVAGCCLLIMTPAVNFSRLRPPTTAILKATLPMGAFQVGGHMFSSMAISRIHVSTVHTIKALSPLFTVAAYALLFGVKYSPKTYISLLPLTIGVMLASTFDTSASSPLGVLCAFGSALIFVSSNIYFKKVVPSGSQASSHRLDKVNLLFYSSSAAFILMVPLWSFTDLPRLLASLDNPTYSSHSNPSNVSVQFLAYNFTLNGLVHFAQNIIAFVILSSTSPVTYSIASLVKRIWVICMAILWFNQRVHPIQGLGIGLTFVGLYMYNATKTDVEKGEIKVKRVEAARGMMLPSNRMEEQLLLNGSAAPSPKLLVDPVASSATGMQSRPQCPPSPSSGIHSQAPDMFSSPLERKPPAHIPPLTLPSAIIKRPGVVSPADQYPSPPPSLDSPPNDMISLSLPSSHLPGVALVRETQVFA